MLEVEIKASLGERTIEEIEAAAADEGFVRAGRLQETDAYFNGNDRDFLKTDEALRLRSCTDMDLGVGETVITYKGPKIDDASITRKEYETQIGDLNVMGDILMALGYQAAFTVEKVRQEWVLQGIDGAPDITLCLDDVKNLGVFMELETMTADNADQQPAVERLLSLLDRFGIDRENLTRRSYLEMLYF